MNLNEARQITRKTGSTRVNDGNYYIFEGGLNLTDPPLRTPPGNLLGCLNYEIGDAGGYRSIAGYERYDGKTLPSAAPYTLVEFSGATPANYPAAGVLVTGTGGSGYVLEVLDPDANGVGTLVLGRFTGAWASSITITAGAFSATTTTANATNSALNDDDDAAYHLLAVEDQRAQIGAVPGQGAILGCCVYRGVTYALRRAVASSNVAMYKSSSSGWQLVNFGRKLRFKSGANEVLPGDTLTGNTSGASGIVRRVVLSKGSWASGTAEGFFIIPTVTGAFTTTENLKVGATVCAVSTAADAAQTMTFGGRFEFRIHNFYGHTSTLRLYGVDGVNNGWEYQDNPEFFCQIETGMVNDAPKFIAVHKGILWLAFSGGSIQRSGVNDPVVFSVVTGASEIALGDEPTGFLEEVADVLFVFTRDQTQFIQGDGPDFSLKSFNIETGAFPYTVQRIGQGVYLDDRGMASLTTTQKFGNYQGQSISVRIQPLINEIKLHATASCVSKANSTYRLFFDDGRFISTSFNGAKLAGFTVCDYTIPVRCIWDGEDANGAGVIVFGSDSGYVYIADSGTSFDGAEITTFARLPFNHNKSPSRIKRYRMAEFDISTNGACSLRIGVDYSYARAGVQADPTRLFSILAGGGFWDISKWNQFRWNAGFTGQASIKLEGAGQNVGFLLSTKSAVQPQHSINGIALRFSMRRMERRSI